MVNGYIISKEEMVETIEVLIVERIIDFIGIEFENVEVNNADLLESIIENYDKTIINQAIGKLNKKEFAELKGRTVVILDMISMFNNITIEPKFYNLLKAIEINDRNYFRKF